MVKFYAVIMVDTLEDDKDQSKECLGGSPGLRRRGYNRQQPGSGRR